MERVEYRHEAGKQKARLLYQAYPPGDIAVIMVPREYHGLTISLTATERGILERLLDGAPLHAIARHRNTSPRTIANQCASIYRKLGVASRYECISRIAGIQYAREMYEHRAHEPVHDMSQHPGHVTIPGVTVWNPRPAGVSVVDIWQGFLRGIWRLRDHRSTGGDWIFIAQRRLQPVALTAREIAILGYVLRGDSNKFIALELRLTESSIATYLRRAMDKLCIHSRSLLIKTIPGWVPETV